MKKQEPISKVVLVNNCLRNMESIVSERWELIDMLRYKHLSSEDAEFIKEYGPIVTSSNRRITDYSNTVFIVLKKLHINQY